MEIYDLILKMTHIKNNMESLHGSRWFNHFCMQTILIYDMNDFNSAQCVKIVQLFYRNNNFIRTVYRILREEIMVNLITLLSEKFATTCKILRKRGQNKPCASSWPAFSRGYCCCECMPKDLLGSANCDQVA